MRCSSPPTASARIIRSRASEPRAEHAFLQAHLCYAQGERRRALFPCGFDMRLVAPCVETEVLSPAAARPRTEGESAGPLLTLDAPGLDGEGLSRLLHLGHAVLLEPLTPGSSCSRKTGAFPGLWRLPPPPGRRTAARGSPPAPQARMARRSMLTQFNKATVMPRHLSEVMLAYASWKKDRRRGLNPG